jgi:hypothetical protein
MFWAKSREGNDSLVGRLRPYFELTDAVQPMDSIKSIDAITLIDLTQLLDVAESMGPIKSIDVAIFEAMRWPN